MDRSLDTGENLEAASSVASRLSPNRMSNNENGFKSAGSSKRRENEWADFLQSLSESERNICKKLKKMSMSPDETLEYMGNHLNPEDLQRAKEALYNSGSGFFEDLTESDQEFAELYISKRDYKILDEIIKKTNKYGEETKRAYAEWKGQERPDKEKQEGKQQPPPSASDLAEEIDSMTLLLMGETGVGKSTFINTLVNMIAFSNFDAALRYGLHVPIRSRMTYSDLKFERHTIDCESTVEDNTEGVELCQDGISCTQKPITYVFRFGPLGNQRMLRIIDTPGFGDTRGKERDKENLQGILDGIAQHEEIHGIVYLMKPNESKLTDSFCYCLNEFLAHLHVEAKKNILFCFTHSRGTSYLPGETLTALEVYFKPKELGIPLSRNNLFSVENDSFRYMCAVKQGANLATGVAIHIESWNQSAQEYKRLLKTVSSFEPHKVFDMLSVNNIRKIIQELTVPLVEISRLHIVNVELIRDHVCKLEKLKRGEHSEEKKEFGEVYLMTEYLENPELVCTNPNCSETLIIHELVKERKYKSCYTPLKLNRPTKFNVKGEKTVHECEIFNGGDFCTKCRHSYQEHKYINYKILTKLQKMVDIEEGRKGVQKTHQFLLKKKEEYEQELTKITGSMAAFSVFMKDHSILTYNDTAADHLDKFIALETETKAGNGRNLSLKDNLQQYKEEYLMKVRDIEAEEHSKANSLEDLNHLITDLKNSPNCGKFLRDIENLELSAKRKQQSREEIVVDLGAAFNKNIWPN